MSSTIEELRKRIKARASLRELEEDYMEFIEDYMELIEEVSAEIEELTVEIEELEEDLVAEQDVQETSYYPFREWMSKIS
jgi:prefoldin subunit 5